MVRLLLLRETMKLNEIFCVHPPIYGILCWPLFIAFRMYDIYNLNYMLFTHYVLYSIIDLPCIDFSSPPLTDQVKITTKLHTLSLVYLLRSQDQTLLIIREERLHHGSFFVSFLYLADPFDFLFFAVFIFASVEGLIRFPIDDSAIIVVCAFSLVSFFLSISAVVLFLAVVATKSGLDHFLPMRAARVASLPFPLTPNTAMQYALNTDDVKNLPNRASAERWFMVMQSARAVTNALLLVALSSSSASSSFFLEVLIESMEATRISLPSTREVSPRSMLGGIAGLTACCRRDDRRDMVS
mmetsp:Transcript_13404/g.21079  ORF Transcript_13404/g.21079 Transcript_13404/m.21079 type:complete len:298 (+) Transcript_13404:61-954(+)